MDSKIIIWNKFRDILLKNKNFIQWKTWNKINIILLLVIINALYKFIFQLVMRVKTNTIIWMVVVFLDLYWKY